MRSVACWTSCIGGSWYGISSGMISWNFSIIVVSSLGTLPSFCLTSHLTTNNSMYSLFKARENWCMFNTGIFVLVVSKFEIGSGTSTNFLPLY